MQNLKLRLKRDMSIIKKTRRTNLKRSGNEIVKREKRERERERERMSNRAPGERLHDS